MQTFVKQIILEEYCEFLVKNVYEAIIRLLTKTNMRASAELNPIIGQIQISMDYGNYMLSYVSNDCWRWVFEQKGECAITSLQNVFLRIQLIYRLNILRNSASLPMSMTFSDEMFNLIDDVRAFARDIVSQCTSCKLPNEHIMIVNKMMDSFRNGRGTLGNEVRLISFAPSALAMRASQAS
jgi:hypothetical protein